MSPGADPGFGIGGGGAWVGEGPGEVGEPPPPPKLWGFEELQTFIWTTILNQPHHFCRIIVNSMFLSDYKNLK